MPEGDSIRRIATHLGPRLVGQTIERATTQGLVREVLAGKQVVAVEPYGKHLVIELADGSHVRAHLGINGRQRTYARAEGEQVLARSSPGRISLALVTSELVALWINAKTIEVSDRRAPRHGMAVAALGPDVLADDFDPVIAGERAATHGGRRIGDVLLDQRVAAGIGNIYKSEALFLAAVDPRRHVGELARETLVALYATARRIMLENLGPGARTTRDRLAGDAPGDDRYFVYGRTNRPCRTCTRPIDCYPLGDPPRWTWSCATCQPLVGPGSETGASR